MLYQHEDHARLMAVDASLALLERYVERGELPPQLIPRGTKAIVVFALRRPWERRKA